MKQGFSQKKIAFYAPMKSPNHSAPSGDRQMARHLISALRMNGYDVDLVSELRVFLRDPDNGQSHAELVRAAKEERQRIATSWAATGCPDLWVSYHPYYKSPDLLGPSLCSRKNIPWVTFEASLSKRRSIGYWTDFQNRALDAVRKAAVNVAYTFRDMEGLHEVDPHIKVEHLRPFIDLNPFLSGSRRPTRNHLITVAMMREGDKLQSYEMLAEALSKLVDLDWHLTIVGDGPAKPKVETRFAKIPERRITWAGKLDRSGIVKVMSEGSILVWPGWGEAFGLVYLEAQAAGLPIVAMNVAGVPEVVAGGRTGILSPAGDIDGYSGAIRSLLSDQYLREKFSGYARDYVRKNHSLEQAAQRIGNIFDKHIWRNTN